MILIPHTIGWDIIMVALIVYVIYSIFGICSLLIKSKFKILLFLLIQLAETLEGTKRVPSKKKRKKIRFFLICAGEVSILLL